MDSGTVKLLDKNLNSLKNRNVFEKKNLYIGLNNYDSEYVLIWLEKHGYEIKGVFTTEDKFIGQTLHGYTLEGLTELLIPYKKENLVLIIDSSNHYLNLRLDALGYFYNDQRFAVMEQWDKISFKNRVYNYAKRVGNNRFLIGMKRLLKRGNDVYTGLKKQTSDSTQLLLFPHRSLGDICILGSYRKYQAKVFEQEYSLIVIGNVCKKIAEEMGFQRVIAIEQTEMDGMVKLKDVLGDQLPDVQILHYQYSMTSISTDVSYEGKVSFFQDYQYLVFNQDLKEMCRPEEDGVGALEYCEKNGIVKGKTVILAPYAKSIRDISVVFWESLAKELHKEGYQVITNCNGSTEFPIKGSKGLFLPLEFVNSIVEYAGYFIGLRSGFCDLVCTLKCTKVILYPKWDWGNSTIMEHYTFDNVNCNVKIKEYEVDIETGEEEVQEVVKLMQSFDNV